MTLGDASTRLILGYGFNVEAPHVVIHVVMDELRFEWDGNKDALNQTKHQVSF